MNLMPLATSRWGPSLAMLLCRVLPCQVIHRLGKWMASYLAGRLDLGFVSALRGNMAVVLGLPEEHPEVDQAVGQLISNAISSYADLFRAVQAGPEKARSLCKPDATLRRTIEECLSSGDGLLLVGAHMCSFDTLLLGLGELFPSVQVLTKANPTGSTLVMNDIRAKHGVEVTPISVASLRQAVERLRQGGVVAIAADVPVENGEELTFFGFKSALPVGHTRLALGTGARIMVGASHRVGEGAYRAEVALAPKPESTGDRKQDVVRWAQDSLSMLESFIRRWPQEWLMPIPVWPG